MDKQMKKMVEKIANQYFQTVPQGYDINEVDSFLNTICDDLDAIAAKLETMAEGTSATPSFSPATPVPVEIPAQPIHDESEEVVGIVSMAQQMYKQTMKEAQEKADKIIEDATLEALESNEAIYAEQEKLNETIVELKAKIDLYKQTLTNYIQEATYTLETIEEAEEETQEKA